MSAQNYYTLAALPALGDFGSEPPLTPAALQEALAEHPAARTLVETIFLSDDLLQHQAFLAGELRDVAPRVLDAAQVRGEQPLPGWFSPAEEETRRPAPLDDVWEAYFAHAARTAAASGSRFLAAWVRHEATLRNALVSARAKALGLEADRYQVAAHLADEEEDLGRLLSEWGAAANPLAGLQILDKARWEWLGEQDRWFSFSDDELAAYAAKLMILQRWQRLAPGRPTMAGASAGADA